MNNDALDYGDTSFLEMGFHRLVNEVRRSSRTALGLLFLKQVAESKDCELIGAWFAHNVEPSEKEHGGRLDMRVFHAWIAEAKTLLPQENASLWQ